MNRSALVASCAALLAAVVGCASASKDGSAVLAEGQNTAGRDITVLQAWIGDDVTIDNSGVSTGGGARYVLDRSQCDVARSTTSNSQNHGRVDHVLANCARGLKAAAKVNGGESPLLTDAMHEWEAHTSTNTVYSRTGRCELVEVRTLMANDILAQPTFDGVGFSYEGREVYVHKNALHKVGDVTMADGRAGSVHRFFAQGTCMGMGGNGGTLYSRNYVFKPYARFVDGGQNHNVWDSANDYLLGRNGTNWVQRFDRQSELLAR